MSTASATMNVGQQLELRLMQILKNASRISYIWPTALIALGLMLTLAWASLLIWLPLHLLNLM
jgi:hypothetical protein